MHLRSIRTLPPPVIGISEELGVALGDVTVSLAVPLAGIDALPVEILCLIFELSIPRLRARDGFRPAAYKLSGNQAPLSLTHVSGHWRAVALGTPALWNSIRPTKCPLPDIRRWISVTPKLRYHLTLSYCDYGELFDLFATTSNRWETISLKLEAELAEQFLSLLRHRANLPIEGLSLYFMDDVPEAVVTEIFTLLAALPSLDCIHFQSSTSCPGLPNLPLSRLKIISAYLDTCSLQEIISYISQCSSATKAMFGALTLVDEESFGQNYFASARRLITLPNLTCLTLERGADPILLLPHLDLPYLRYLSIEIRHRNTSILNGFISRTVHLQTLVIDEPIAEDQPHDPAPASNDDLLEHFTSPVLRHIPRVEITFRHAHKRVIDIIQSYNGPSSNLSPLICWVGDAKAGTFYSPAGSYPFVGWGEGLAQHPELLWSYQDGEFHRTPLYSTKLLHKYF